MRKTLLPALFLLVLTAPLIGQEPPTTPKSNVSVLIDSRPDYAEIQIDGKFIGTTPLNYRLTPGVHRVALTRPHYSPWVRDLTVTDRVPTRIGALLEQTTAQNPCGATETPGR
jgi:PEGA domain